MLGVLLVVVVLSSLLCFIVVIIVVIDLRDLHVIHKYYTTKLQPRNSLNSISSLPTYC